MKQERKNYDPAFQTKAVEFSIKVTFLYKWQKEYEEFEEGSLPGKENLKLTQEQIHELEKELEELLF